MLKIRPVTDLVGQGLMLVPHLAVFQRTLRGTPGWDRHGSGKSFRNAKNATVTANAFQVLSDTLFRRFPGGKDLIGGVEARARRKTRMKTPGW